MVGGLRRRWFAEGFRVEMLPDDADPMDIRYNMIQWVHRSTRGWSYGNAVTEGIRRGFRFISDSDSRPPGGAHPQSHLSDNSTNAAEELDRMMQMRRRALDRFGENAIRPGAPMSTLGDVLVPVYPAHRYQVEAAAKAAVQHHARDSSMPSPESLLDALLAATWDAPRAGGLAGDVQRTVDAVVVYRLMAPGSQQSATAHVRGVVLARLGLLSAKDESQQHLLELIERFRKDPKRPMQPAPMQPPPGQPI